MHGSGVDAPYFSLDAVERPRGGEARARVRVEQPLCREGGPIALAEAVRHLGTLGACAAATEPGYEEVKVFLPSQVRFVRRGSSASLADFQFAASAEVLFAGRKEMRARMHLLEENGGGPLVSLVMAYRVVTRSSFCREFPQVAEVGSFSRGGLFSPDGPEKGAPSSPFSTRLPLRLDASTADAARSSLMVTPEWCAGHVGSCPIVPLSVLVAGMVETASRSFGSQPDADEHRMLVLDASVAQQEQVLGGGALVFEAQCLGESDGRLGYSAVARTGGDTAGGQVVASCRLACASVASLRRRPEATQSARPGFETRTSVGSTTPRPAL